MHFKQKWNLFFSPPTLHLLGIASWLYLLSSTTQQVMYVLENAPFQLKHQTPVPDNSNLTDLTEQQMSDNTYARNSFLSFWRQFIHSQTGQICFVMQQSVIQWKWVSNFQGNSPISLPTTLAGAPGEITIEQTFV